MFDVTTDVRQRFLQMGSDPLDTLGIQVLTADSKEQKALVGKQTGGQPTRVIYTTALEEEYQKLKENSVKIKLNQC